MKKNTFKIIHENLLFKKKIVSLIFFMFIALGSINAQFVHPGLSHKKSDLERMKAQVKSDIEPWASTYKILAADYFSKYTYLIQGNSSMTVVRRGVTNNTAYEKDMTAAYQNALMWWLTDDQRHADKAIEILNTWSNLKSVPGIPLDVALYVAPMVTAAELIKSSSAGWAEADMQKFSDMLVYPGYSNTTIPNIDNDNHTFYWGIYNGDPKRAGNQELAAYKAMISIGIFLDNEIIYDRALRYVSDQNHRSDDLPYESGPKTSTSIVADQTNEYRISYNWTQQFTIPDYGYDGVISNYIYDNGQCQESSRDQTHAMYGVSLAAQIAEIAWNQGDDLYSFADNRILLGLEYHLRYNLSYENSYPDQITPWEPTVASGEYYEKTSRTARNKSLKINPYKDVDVTRVLRGLNITRPYWETPLNHYKYRTNIASEKYKWLQRGRDLNIEKTGKHEGRSDSYTDHQGWGDFTHGRPEGCYGDPISGFSGSLPVYEMNTFLKTIGDKVTIEAENFDHPGAMTGQDRTYNDVTTNNSGGEYRTNESVDLKVCSEGGYNITSIQDSEWLVYTVYVPTDGTYNFSVRYAAANGNGKIKMNFNGVDVTNEVPIPFGGSNSTSLTDWKDLKIASDVTLTKGVQAFKVLFSGADNSFELNNFTFETITSSGDDDGGNGDAACGNIIIGNQIDGENFCYSQGGTVKDASEGGSYIGGIKNGDFFNYGNFDFDKNTANAVEVAIGKSSTKETFVEIRLDSTTGTLIGTVDASETAGGSQNWKSYKATLDAVSGEHEVFLLFTGQPGVTLVNYNWFRFYDSTLSIDKNDTSFINVYPNPVSDKLFISNSKNLKFEIYNNLGQLKLKKQLKSNQETFDMSTFSTGIYFIKIFNVKGVEVRKIMKK